MENSTPSEMWLCHALLSQEWLSQAGYNAGCQAGYQAGYQVDYQVGFHVGFQADSQADSQCQQTLKQNRCDSVYNAGITVKSRQ